MTERLSLERCIIWRVCRRCQENTVPKFRVLPSGKRYSPYICDPCRDALLRKLRRLS